MRTPYPQHCAIADTRMRCHAARAPVRRIVRRGLRGQSHDFLRFSSINLGRATTSRKIFLQRLDAAFHETSTPTSHTVPRRAQLGSNGLICSALGCSQNDACACAPTDTDGPRAHPLTQNTALAVVKDEGLFHRHSSKVTVHTYDRAEMKWFVNFEALH